MGVEGRAGSLSGFSAARVQQRIQRLAPNVAADAPEFMAAVLEVVASQMLQRAGDAAAVENCGRIEPHHIRVAVRQDNDLSRLVGEDALAQGGLLRPAESDDEQGD
jgi:molybdopterin-guanine dinucleotide biosynthesis protein A